VSIDADIDADGLDDAALAAVAEVLVQLAAEMLAEEREIAARGAAGDAGEVAA
jgi:hypothetical protein